MQESLDRDARRFPWGFIATGLLVYLLIQSLVIGVPGVGGSSEAREAQVIDVIVRDGTWVLPLRNGLIPSKPPLYHWAGALFSKALGETSMFTARFPCQVFAALVFLLVSLTTYRFAAVTASFQSRAHPRRAALLAAGIASLTYGIYQLGCQAMVDMTFALCVWGAIACVVLSDRAMFRFEGRIAEGNRSMFWLCCALGMLARGPLGAVLPVFLVGIAGWCVMGFRRTFAEFLRPSFGWLAFGIPITWYYFAYKVGGEPFLQRQILFENLQRLSGGEHVNEEVWWFYLPSLLRTTFPWGVLVLAIALRTITSPRSLSYHQERRTVRWLPLIVLGAGVALFSCSSGKRHSYLLSLLPFVAMQLSVELSSLFESGGSRARERCMRVGRSVELVLSAFFIVAVCALVVVSEGGVLEGAMFDAMRPPLVAVGDALAPVLVLCAFGTLLTARRGASRLFAGVWFLAILLMTTIVATGAAVKAHFKGFEEMTSAWLAQARPQERLAVVKGPFDEYFDPILYYMHRPVSLVSTEQEVLPCEANTLYGARLSWMERNRDKVPSGLSTVMILRERLSTIRGDGGRDIVLYRCPRDGEYPAAPMQDAFIPPSSDRMG